jgi:hypothetical protein
LRLAHQNDPKHIKKLFLAKKIDFFGNKGWLAFPNRLLVFWIFFQSNFLRKNNYGNLMNCDLPLVLI